MEVEPLDSWESDSESDTYTSEQNDVDIAISDSEITEADLNEERNKLNEIKESFFVSPAFYYFVLGVFICSIFVATAMVVFYFFSAFWISQLIGFFVILITTYVDTAVGVVAEYHIDSIPESTERIKSEITKKLKQFKKKLNQQIQNLSEANDSIEKTNKKLEHNVEDLENITNGFKEVTRHCGELYDRIMREEGVDTSFHETLERALEKIKILTLFYKYRDNTKHKQIEQRMTKQQRIKELTTMDVEEYKTFKLQLKNRNKDVFEKLDGIKFEYIAGKDKRIDLYELETMLEKILKVNGRR